jgi:hypothetical protein
MTYRLVKAGLPTSTLRDIWELKILVQGNAAFNTPANGNRIVVRCVDVGGCGRGGAGSAPRNDRCDALHTGISRLSSEYS